MAKIKLIAKLPGEEHNGLVQFEDDWDRTAQPDDLIVIARIAREDVKVSRHGEYVPRAVIDQLEVVNPEDLEDADAIMRRACAGRGGTMTVGDRTSVELDISDEDDDLDEIDPAADIPSAEQYELMDEDRRREAEALGGAL